MFIALSACESNNSPVDSNDSTIGDTSSAGTIARATSRTPASATLVGEYTNSSNEAISIFPNEDGSFQLIEKSLKQTLVSRLTYQSEAEVLIQTNALNETHYFKILEQNLNDLRIAPCDDQDGTSVHYSEAFLLNRK